MDIRNWFTSSKGPPQPVAKKSPQQSSAKAKNKETKSQKRRIVDSDSDEEPAPKKVPSRGKKSVSPNQDTTSHKKHKPNLPKRRVLESSDDECMIEMDSDSEGPKKKMSPKKQLKTKSPKQMAQLEPPKTLKAASVSDYFGSAPIQRSSKTTSSKSSSAKSSIEVNHEDEDFSKTLMQLEESDKKSDKNSSSTKAKKEKASLKSKGTNKKPLDIEIVPSPAVEKKKKVIEVTPPEKKKKPPKAGSANYLSYLNREGPRALGSKEIPEGEEECLKGKTFVISGVLESIERDEAKELIEKYCGKVTGSLSKKTDYIVIGRDAGASKLEKAVTFGTKQLDEDGLFELIRNSPGTGPKKIQPSASKDSVKTESKNPFSQFAMKNSSDEDLLHSVENGMEETKDEKPDILSNISSKINKDVHTENSVEKEISPAKSSSKPSKQKSPSKTQDSLGESSQVQAKASQAERTGQHVTKSDDAKVPSAQLWVDKYKPMTLKQVIGQQGDKSNAKKLLNWLCNWSKNVKTKRPVAAGRWNTNDDGAGFKAALLSGPPGVGKTTTAQLVCKESGFDYIELNASDTRSKKSLQSIVSEMLLNQSLSSCFGDDGKITISKKHTIIMDEVDGMAGNEDRGGIQELIAFIKASKIPIICICNDRNHPKIRSLSNYCFDLRFQKPRVEQIKSAMMSIAFKEGISVSPTVLHDVITASNQDIRQVIHNLSLWCSRNKGLSEEQAKKDIGQGTKHIKMSPFDVLREVFAIGHNKKATINDKAELFFHDYSIAPLFVQENYVHVLPSASGGNKQKHLQLLSEAANSLCIGDTVDKQIRSRSSWSLLPIQAIFASVIPGELLTGHLKQMISFPAWLGKNSTRNHMDRVLQELQMHMRMRITGSKTDVALEYLPLLKRALTKPLLDNETEGVKDALKVMSYYYLLREDFDSIIDLSLWPNQKDPRSQISAKVKSAFTRAYNKECTQNPYAVTSVTKKKKGSNRGLDELPGEEEDYVSESEDVDDEKIENDAMIKMKKQPAKKPSADLKSKESSKSQGKRGRPRK